jgi:U6 snRNA-associated Sm-like protein LSm8
MSTVSIFHSFFLQLTTAQVGSSLFSKMVEPLWCALIVTLGNISGPTLAIQGIMAGFDQKSNVVLSDSKERVFSVDEGVQEISLGLYLVKGDMMSVILHLQQLRSHGSSSSVLIGEIDEALDQSVDLASIRAEPIPAIRY